MTACRPGTVPGETSEAVLGETPADLAGPTPCGEGQVSLRAPKRRVAVLCPGRPLVHTRKEQPCVRLGQCSRAFPGGLGAAQRPGLWPAQPVSSCCSQGSRTREAGDQSPAVQGWGPGNLQGYPRVIPASGTFPARLSSLHARGRWARASGTGKLLPAPPPSHWYCSRLTPGAHLPCQGTKLRQPWARQRGTGSAPVRSLPPTFLSRCLGQWKRGSPALPSPATAACPPGPGASPD